MGDKVTVYQPQRSKWTAEDTEDVLITGGCCLLVIIGIVMGILPYIAWFSLYLAHGRPDLFSNWNAWNISLLVIIAVQVFGASGTKASGR